MQYRLGKNLFGARFCASDTDRVFTVCYPMDDDKTPDPDYSAIVETAPSGSRLLGEFPYDITGITWFDKRLHCIDSYGNLHIYHDGNWEISETRPAAVIRLTGLRVIEEQLYAFGLRGRVMHLERGAWSEVVQELMGFSIFDVTQNNSAKLLCVGTKGLFTKIEGGLHVPVDTGTNAGLTSLLATQNNGLILTGWHATALVGSENELTQIDVGTRTLTIYNCVHFGGQYFFSATSDVAVLDANELAVFSKRNSKRLISTDTFLWNLGDDGLSYTDGPDWNDANFSFELNY